jgi:hypothetical protein
MNEMPLPRASLFRVVAMSTAVLGGCSAEAGRYIHFPDFAHPGPEAVQRAQAIQHDPYPLNDVGPEIVGGRPLAYQQSLTEQERARLVPPLAGRLVPVPVPGSTVVAPPVLASPIAVAPPQPGMALPTSPPGIVTSPAAPVAAPPYSMVPAPAVTSPYPGVSQPAAFPAQQRAPY